MTETEAQKELETEKALDYERYVAARDAANALSADQSKVIDQTILAFAGGGLGITLTFMHDFVKVPVAPYLLYAGDGFLLASIIAVLISLYASQKSVSDHIDDLDEAARNDFGAAHTEFMKTPYINLWAMHTEQLNKAAMFSVIMGILLVALFVFQNLTGKEAPPMNKQVETKVVTPPPTTGQKGAVLRPPAVPPKTTTTQSPPATEKK